MNETVIVLHTINSKNITNVIDDIEQNIKVIVGKKSCGHKSVKIKNSVNTAVKQKKTWSSKCLEMALWRYG